LPCGARRNRFIFQKQWLSCAAVRNFVSAETGEGAPKKLNGSEKKIKAA